MPSTKVPTGKCCAIVLAAGAGSRFRATDGRVGVHKLTALLSGRPVSSWALEAVRQADFETVIVVTGAIELDPHSTSFATIVHNPGWASGQATSLQCGLRVADKLGTEAVVVGLGDQPFITAAAWRAVAASPSEIAVATYPDSDGRPRRANPVLLRRSIWALLPSEGDQGARSLMSRRPELVTEVSCTGSPVDIDTMEDLQQWNSSTNSP